VSNKNKTVLTMKTVKIITLLILTLSATSIFAKSDFCRGFEIGYKTVKGNMSIVPICPIAPITPIGSTPYQEGIKAGIRAAG
tara:strand:+ start:783 stop:1028 length:246 start_codon:yes stop_codon:yes gene_type:complete